MAITLASQSEANGFGTSLAIPHSSPADRLLVVYTSSSGGPTVSIADNAGHTWTKVGDTLDFGATGHAVGQMFYTMTTAAVSTITLSRGTATNWGAKVTQWSGVGSFVEADLGMQPTLETVSAVTDDLVLSAAFYYNPAGTGPTTAPTGFTALTTSVRPTNFITASAYSTATAPGEYGADWGTLPSPAGLIVVAFRPVASKTHFRKINNVWVPQALSIARSA